MTEEYVACPMCGEQILSVAKKCKHCGSMIEAGDAVSTANVSNDNAKYLEFAMLGIPLLSTILIWLWVGQMNLNDSPEKTLSGLMLFTVIGTAIIAAIEAAKVDMSGSKVKGTYTPIVWFILFALLWFVAYPYYLAKRRYYGLANKMIAGLLLMIVFIGSYLTMSGIIQYQREHVFEQFQQQIEQMKR